MRQFSYVLWLGSAIMAEKLRSFEVQSRGGMSLCTNTNIPFTVPHALSVHSPKYPSVMGFIAHLRLIFTAV
jgi:hypothetical protein